MHDLIAVLDAKENEIMQFVKVNRAERENLSLRLAEIDDTHAAAEEDLRRINKARNALRNPTEAKMVADDHAAMREMQATTVMPAAPTMPYSPTR